MARRSASNPRYQKQKGGELGKTRRSAASAKPKRHLGESAEKSAASAAKKGKGKGKKKRPPLLAPLPTSPEFRRWRKIWMGLLGAAVAFSLVAWQMRDTMPGAISLALAYGCIFSSLYVDFAKMRPLRKSAIAGDQAARAGAKDDGKKESKKTSEAPEADAQERGE